MKAVFLSLISGLVVLSSWIAVLSTPPKAMFLPPILAASETPTSIVMEITPTPQIAQVNVVSDTLAPQNSPVLVVQVVVVVQETVFPTETLVVATEPPALASVTSMPEAVSPTETVVDEPVTPVWAQWIGTPYPELLTSEVYPLVAAPDIDQIWDAVATPEVLSQGSASGCPAVLPRPYVTWDMASRLSLLDGSDSETISLPASTVSAIAAEGGGYFPDSGVVTVPEAGLESTLMSYVLRGVMQVCQTGTGRHDFNVYGPGVQEFLDMLATYYLH